MIRTLTLLIVAVLLCTGRPAQAYRDLEAGVFITRDPAGFVDGRNLYTYVRQNPWTAFDPQGLLTKLTLAGATYDDDDPRASFHEEVDRETAREKQMAEDSARFTDIEGNGQGQKLTYAEQKDRDLATGNPGPQLFYAGAAGGEVITKVVEEVADQAPWIAASMLLEGAPMIAGGVAEGLAAAEEGTYAAKTTATIAGEGTHIALGSRMGGLRTFASDIGAKHLLDVPESQWKQVFLSHVENPSTKFSISMNGFYGSTTEEMIANEIASGSNTG